MGCLNVAISTTVFYFCYTQWHVGSFFAGIGNSFGISDLNGAVSSVIAYGVGMINSFILNKLWTFKIQNGTLTQARRFFILNMIGLLLTTLIIFICVDVLNGPYMLVWFITVALVMILNFIGNKYWTFIEESPGTR